jgi:hypothetical protein
MQREVGPLDQLPIPFEANRTASIGLTGERAQRAVEFLRLNASVDADRTDVMAVKSLRQSSQHGLTGVGRDAVDDQLASRDTERDQGPLLEQSDGPAHESVDHGAKRGMSARVHRVAMKRDGQLDEELTQLTRQNARP